MKLSALEIYKAEHEVFIIKTFGGNSFSCKSSYKLFSQLSNDKMFYSQVRNFLNGSESFCIASSKLTTNNLLFLNIYIAW